MKKEKRKYIILFIILTFIIFVDYVNASNIVNIGSAKFCQREEVAKIIKLILFFFDLVRVGVPIILIIATMIKLTKAITSGDGLEKQKKPIISSIIAAVLIFLLPSFVSVITKITNTFDDINECIELTDNPIKTEPEELPDDPSDPSGDDEPESEEGSPVISSIKHSASFVIVNAKKGTKGSIAGYYFSTNKTKPTGKEDNWVISSDSKLEIAKIPGTYYVYVKDNLNNISNPSTLKITWEELYNDGTRSRDVTFPPINGEIDDVLKSKGDSLNNLNNFIAWSVRSAGLFTKEGVATAGVSFNAYLHYKYNIQVSYVCNHYCFGQRYNVAFGGNPKWGHVIKLGDISVSSKDYTTGEIIYPRQLAQSQGIKKYCKGEYGGLDCQSFFGWSLHNAGFKAENTHGSYVGKNKASEESCGNNCSKAQMEALLNKLVLADEVINKSHVMLFLTHYDDNKDGINDGIYVYEAATRVGMKKWSYAELYSSQYFTINHMAGYYENSSNYACLLDSNGNKVSVPDAWKDKENLFRTNCKASN